MLEAFPEAFLAVMTPGNVVAMIVGTIAGIIIGALPGINVTVGIAILIPLTFGMEPLYALGLIAGIFNGASYGNAIPAVLVNVPGTPAAVATTFDGYPMAQQGKSALALRIACYSSALGAIVSAISLILIAPPLSRVTLLFGPAEYFWLAILGLSSIAVLLGDDPVKGMIAACFGMLLATVGMDQITGVMRFSFGYWELADGLPTVVLLTGLFAFSRVLLMAQERKLTGVSGKELRLADEKPDWSLMRSLIPTWLRSTVMGLLIGILPGVGGNAAALLAYNEEKRASKEPETFGRGNPKGVAAAECGNSADNSSSLIPTLTLGVPGNAIAAIIMGALLVHGLQPGPSLFRDEPVIVYGFMIQMLLTAMVLFVLGGMVATRIFSQVLRLPGVVLVPLIVSLMTIGIYTSTYEILHLYLAIAFGLIGYFMLKLDFPFAPFVLGIILGGVAEFNLRVALRISQGEVAYLFQNAVSKILIALLALILFTAVSRFVKDWRRRARSAGSGPATEQDGAGR
jgi:putative tricarboxylic transport membrane protein